MALKNFVGISSLKEWFGRVRALLSSSRYIPAFLVLVLTWTITSIVILGESHSINGHAHDILEAIHHAPLSVANDAQGQIKNDTFTLPATRTASEQTARSTSPAALSSITSALVRPSPATVSAPTFFSAIISTSRPAAASATSILTRPRIGEDASDGSDDDESEEDASSDGDDADDRAISRDGVTGLVAGEFGDLSRVRIGQGRAREALAQQRSKRMIKHRRHATHTSKLLAPGRSRPIRRTVHIVSSRGLDITVKNVTSVNATSSDQDHSFAIFGLGQARPLIVSQECTTALTGPVSWIRSKMIQDQTFIFFRLWIAALGLMAVLHQSVPHLAAFVLGDIAGQAWSISNIVITRTFHDNFHDNVRVGPCEGSDMLPGYWSQILRLETALSIINGLVFVAVIFMASRLFKVLSWMTFERLGASREVSIAHRIMLSFNIALQTGTLFIMAFQIIWLAEICAHSDRTDHYKIGLGALTALTVPWLLLGWHATRRESKSSMAVFLIFNLALLGNFGYLLSDKMKALATNASLWKFLLFLGSVSIIFSSATLILGLVAIAHFGKGLLRCDNRRSLGDRSLDGGYNDAYINIDSKHDGDNSAFPTTTKSTLPRSYSNASTLRAMAQLNRANSAGSRNSRLSPAEENARELSVAEAAGAVMIQVAPPAAIVDAKFMRRDPAELAATEARHQVNSSWSASSTLTFDSGNAASPRQFAVGTRVVLGRSAVRGDRTTSIASDGFSMISRQASVRSRDSNTSSASELSYATGDPASRTLTPRSTISKRPISGSRVEPSATSLPALPPLDLARWSGMMKQSGA